MDNKQKLSDLCNQALMIKGLPEPYKQRLKTELLEIEVQDECDYFLDLYTRRVKYRQNEYNLLVPYLLGICDGFDIGQETAYIVGESPDIDTDLHPLLRNYIKQEWVAKTFGEEYVAQIGTYGTYKLNNALIDMARIFGKDRNEVIGITKQFELKDDEGESLTWDKALELYPAFKEYCEKNPEVADAAKRLTGRNRNAGQHASGLMISSQKIGDFVPVMGKDYNMSTAWTEGQASSDLGAVGLVKFDLLSLNALQQIAECIELIRQRHGIDKICALPGQKNWSDISYLNDPDALKMANEADMKMTFQFGTEGIRQLVRQGGVTSFNDISAYNSLYRPGPISQDMHTAYCKRKKGEESYEIHPVLQPILGKTYGVMAYQEQVMQILNVVGKIPLRDCEAIRKAISKKKVEKFAKYKEMFIKNGQVVLNISKEEAERLFDQVEAFAGYGFNKSHSVAYGYLTLRQLYLKCHYPIEFYTSYLNNVGGADQDEKLKDGKQVAESHNVRVRRVHLNKSDYKFSIVDEEVYAGFLCLKGIGEEVAKRIAAHRPYKNFDDFLVRFGSDAKACQTMIALRQFDGDPLALYEYYEFFRDCKKKKLERLKRFQDSQALQEAKLREHVSEFTEESISQAELQQPEIAKQLRKTYTSYLRAKVAFAHKVELEDQNPISFQAFAPQGIEIKPEIKKLLLDQEAAEQHYYGFCWTHPLEKCPQAKGFTLENFKVQNNVVGPVEGLITKNIEKVGKVAYRVISLDDVNWEPAEVVVWNDDYLRFKNELAEGNLVRLRLMPPTPPFRRYTLESPPRHKKHLLPKKDLDFRVILLSPPEPEEVVCPTKEIVKEKEYDFDAVTNLDMVII